MPSAFDQLWRDVALPRHEDWFGVNIVYSDRQGNSWPIKDALTTRERSEIREDRYGGESHVITRTARYRKKGNEQIRVDGSIQIGDKKYSIENISDIEAYRQELQLLRTEVIELTKPEYRRIQ